MTVMPKLSASIRWPVEPKIPSGGGWHNPFRCRESVVVPISASGDTVPTK